MAKNCNSCLFFNAKTQNCKKINHIFENLEKEKKIKYKYKFFCYFYSENIKKIKKSSRKVCKICYYFDNNKCNNEYSCNFNNKTDNICFYFLNKKIDILVSNCFNCVNYSNDNSCGTIRPFRRTELKNPVNFVCRFFNKG